MNEQPKLTLLSQKNAFDIEALVALFVKLTGRRPSQDEIETARAEMEQEND